MVNPKRAGIGLTLLSSALLACDDDAATGAGGAGSSTSTGVGAGGVGGEGGGAGLVWAPCEVLFECATLEVPLDDADPSLGTIALKLRAVPAKGEPAGTIILAGAGPGESGTKLAVDSGVLVQHAVGAGWRIVGFDARGVEASSPAVTCGDDAAIDELVLLDTSPDTPAERAALDTFAASWDAACIANTQPGLLARVDPARSARDLERLRQAMGLDKVNLLSFSYGSRTAARYAALYPDRLRGVVMSAPSGPSLDLEEELRLTATGYQDALERFFAWCANGCDGDWVCYHNGGTVEDVRAGFHTTLDAVEAQDLGRRADRGISAALSNRDYEALSKALLALDEGSSAELIALYPPLPKSNGMYPNLPDAFGAIWFADHIVPAGYTGSDLDDFAATVVAPFAPEAIRFVRSQFPYWLAGGYSTQPATPPAPFGSTSAPVLLLASTHDAEVPLEAAEAMRAALGDSAHLLVRDGDGHDPFVDPCVKDAAVAFLRDPTQALPGTCP